MAVSKSKRKVRWHNELKHYGIKSIRFLNVMFFLFSFMVGSFLSALLVDITVNSTDSQSDYMFFFFALFFGLFLYSITLVITNGFKHLAMIAKNSTEIKDKVLRMKNGK